MFPSRLYRYYYYYRERRIIRKSGRIEEEEEEEEGRTRRGVEVSDKMWQKNELKRNTVRWPRAR